MHEEMDLDTQFAHRVRSDPILAPFQDNKRVDPFVDRKKVSFKRRESSPARLGASARDKQVSDRRFGSQTKAASSSALLPDNLMTSLSLESHHRTDTLPRRPFGFSDYSAATTPIRSTPSAASVSSHAGGSPMDVDSGSPEMMEANRLADNLSIFTTALWSTGRNLFQSSPKTTGSAPNPYSVMPASKNHSSEPDYINLVDGMEEEEEEEVIVVKKNVVHGIYESGDNREMLRKNTICGYASPSENMNKQKFCATGRKSKFLYIKYMCQCQFFILFLIVVSLGILHMSNKIKGRTCDANQRLNVTAISASLREQVFGQHIAFEIVVNALDQLMQEQRTMVLSFHGWTGIGKTFVSSIIVEHTVSPSVHRVVVPLHFPHAEDDDAYQERIREWILSNVTACAVNVFIVDEMDKATEGVVKGLASALSHIRHLDLNDSRVLVILISNTGGAAINRYAFRHLESGYGRDQLLGSGLVGGILSDEDTDWLQVLHNSGVIDHIVPFLPLERLHLKQCVEAFVRDSTHYSLQRADVERILDDFTYLPKDYPLFSKSGCRQVNSKVDLLADSGHRDEKRDEL